MYCKQCNREIWDGATVCAYCGATTTPENADSPDSGNSYSSMPWDSTVDNAYDGSNPESSPPSKKNKKLWILIPAILIGVALTIFATLRLILTFSPQYQIVKGASNTVSALFDSIESADTFHSVARALSDYSKADSVALDINFSEGTNRILLSLAKDKSKKLMRTDVSMDTKNFEIDLTLGANKENLMLQLEQLNDNLYTMPLEAFGTEYSDSELSDFISNKAGDLLESLSIDPFAETDFKTFRDTSEDFDNFLRTLELEKIDQSILGLSDLTVYRTTVNLKKIVELYEKYNQFKLSQTLGEEVAEEFQSFAGSVKSTAGILSTFFGVGSSAEMENSSLVLLLGINDDNCLSALYCYDMASPTETIGITLSGEANIWDNVLVYVNNEVVAGMTVVDTPTGFTVDLFEENSGQRQSYLLIECDDLTGELSFSFKDGESFTIKYALTDAEMSLGLAIPHKDISIDLAFTKDPTVLLPEGKETPILEFDRDDCIELLADVLKFLATYSLIGKDIG